MPRTSFAQATSSASAMGAPANLIARTFAPLKSSLLGAGSWKPLPTASERAGWLGLPEDIRSQLVRRADSENNANWPVLLATDELEFQRNGNRSHFEALSFGRRQKLGSLVLGECVQAEGSYLDQIANGVWLICEETFWGAQAHLSAQRAGTGLADASEPIIELFSAETAATLAWVAYLLGERLHAVSKLLVPRIAMETRRRILDPYLTRDDFWWMGTESGQRKRQHLNNWNPWINSNVLVAGLLLEADASRRAALVDKVARSVDQFLADYSPDAGCEEGPGYWSRSAASTFDVLQTMVSAHGGHGESILKEPFVRAMGQYICDVHIAGDRYVNYGDAHEKAGPEPVECFTFGSAAGDAMLADFGSFEGARKGVHFGGNGGGPASLSRELQEVFGAEAMLKGEKKDALPRDAWYPSLGLMTARQTEGSSDGFFVSMQAASNGRPHGHNDSGSFLVYLDGEPVFLDPGVGTYTAQTFSRDRYKIWTMQSGFHTLPTVGGVEQKDGVAFRASRLACERREAQTWMRCDLATAYPKEAGIQQWMRTLTLDRAAKTVKIEERFSLSGPKPVMLSFLCGTLPTLDGSGVRVGKALLAFDHAVLDAKVEPIPLTDPGLEHAWGKMLWRVVLSSKESVAVGAWTLEVRRQ